MLLAAALASSDIEVVGVHAEDSIISVKDVSARSLEVAAYSARGLAEALACMDCKPCYEPIDWEHEEARLPKPSQVKAGVERPRLYPGKAPKQEVPDLLSFSPFGSETLYIRTECNLWVAFSH